MNLADLSRAEKEALYKKKTTELQRRWGNPLDGDWKFVKEITDDVLEKHIRDTQGQIAFEVWWSVLSSIVSIALGMVGLLLFGLKQIF